MKRILVILALLAAAPARADEAPVIDLYTMGQGDDAFSAFGHAALCVTEGGATTCFNYGTTDFSAPLALTWDFLRGRAKFWVSRATVAHLLETYRGYDRSVWRQRLPLVPEAARELATRLDEDTLPEHASYIYHHYKENCATRLRDLIDRATGGRLSVGGERPLATTFRRLTLQGFAGKLPMLLATDFVLGRAADAHPTLWEAMFLPDVLRAEVQRRFDVAPVLVYARRGPPPAGSPTLGRKVLWGVAFALAFLCLALAGRPRTRRIPLVIVGLVLGLLALLVYGLAFGSVLPELRKNELLLVFLPSDFALLWLGGRRLARYLVARIVLCAAVALAAAVGLLVQPLAAPLALAGMPLAVLGVLERGLLGSASGEARFERARPAAPGTQ